MSTRRSDERPRRIRRRPEQAEQEILEAAEAFLQDHDFRELTVDALMRGTGMRRSGFYNYFADRNELTLRLIEPIADEMMQAARPWLDDEGDPRATLAAGLDQVVAIYAQHGRLLRAVHEATYHDHEVERFYRDLLIDRFVDAVARRLRRERRAGRTAVTRPGDIARALLTLNVNVMFERLGRTPADSPRAVAQTLRYVWEQTIYGGAPGAGDPPPVSARAR
jgi:AcrR family transcriptional regulator